MLFDLTIGAWSCGGFCNRLFPIKDKFFAKRKREFITKFEILPNGF